MAKHLMKQFNLSQLYKIQDELESLDYLYDNFYNIIIENQNLELANIILEKVNINLLNHHLLFGFLITTFAHKDKLPNRINLYNKTSEKLKNSPLLTYLHKLK